MQNLDLTIQTSCVQLLTHTDNINRIGHNNKNITGDLVAKCSNSTDISLAVREVKTKYKLSLCKEVLYIRFQTAASLVRERPH